MNVTQKRPNYAALGFVLTVDDAQEVLELSCPGEVYDLVRAGVLAALYLDGAVLFHPEELTAFDFLRRRDLTDPTVRIALRAQAVIRAYLAARPPLPDYDEAVLRQSPLLVAVKRRSVVCVQESALMAFHNGSDAVQLHQDVPITSVSLRSGMEQVGMLRMRGFVAEADRGSGAQRWTWWWRLPDSLVSDVLPEVGLVLHEGEGARSTGGHPHLTTSLTSRDSNG